MLADDRLGPLLAALGTLLEDHFQRHQEEQDAAGDAEGVEADMHGIEQPAATQREPEQDTGRDDHRLDRHPAPVCVRRAIGQRGENRRYAGRVDGDKESHEGGGEEFKHVGGPV